MQEIISTLSHINPLLLICVATLWVLIGLYWFFSNWDHLKHPEEYKDKGSTGERAVYLQMLKAGIKEAQILRNVYIPTKNGTTEIDILVVVKKGILVFEIKNYGGHIYGDGNRKQWIQYVGNKKSYFLNPLLQNRTHVEHIKAFLSDDIPVIPFTSTILRGKWTLKNIDPEDHFLRPGDFLKIYQALPDPNLSVDTIKKLIAKFKPYERPDESVREQHIKRIKGQK